MTLSISERLICAILERIQEVTTNHPALSGDQERVQGPLLLQVASKYYNRLLGKISGIRSSMKTKFSTQVSKLIVGFVFSVLSGLAFAESYTGGQPLSPQPDSASLKPGLAVKYYFEYFGHIDSVSSLTGGMVEGEPLKNIAHRTKTGNVLTADRPMGVAAHIRGMIHLDKTGIYTFRIESNDGVRAHVGGIKIWTDPEIHGNRWSRPLEYEVTEPGWYDFKIDYYQKKGTSALQFAWTPPGATEEEIVPPEAFAH